MSPSSHQSNVGISAVPPQHSQEELALSSFAALLSAAQLNGTTDMVQPQDHHFALKQMLTSSCWPHIPAQCSFPSLSLKRQQTDSRPQNVGQLALKDAAATNLSLPMELSPTNDDIHTIPMRLLHNLVESLNSLIKSRMKSTAFALMRQTQSSGTINKEALMLTKMLIPSQSNTPLKVTTAVTSFRVVPFSNWPSSSEEDMLVLPVVFETVIDVSVLDTAMITVPIRTTGTLAGMLCSTTGLMKKVELKLDSSYLLDELMAKARSLVRQTATAAAAIANSQMHLYKLAKIMAANQEAALYKRQSAENFKYDIYSPSFNTGSSNVVCKDMTTPESLPDEEEDEEEEVAMPRTMSDLSEYQEDPTPDPKSSTQFLVDLNKIQKDHPNSDTPSVRIADLFSILAQEIQFRSGQNTGDGDSTSQTGFGSRNSTSKKKRKRVSFEAYQA